MDVSSTDEKYRKLNSRTNSYFKERFFDNFFQFYAVVFCNLGIFYVKLILTSRSNGTSFGSSISSVWSVGRMPSNFFLSLSFKFLVLPPSKFFQFELKFKIGKLWYKSPNSEV